jgi:hypothetical protein
MRAEARQAFTSRYTLHRLTFALTEFDLNLERCKVTSVLESSQEFALSLLEHDFDSSGLTVEVKNKVLTPVNFSPHRLSVKSIDLPASCRILHDENSHFTPEPAAAMEFLFDPRNR